MSSHQESETLFGFKSPLVLLPALGDVPAAALEHDAGGLDEPSDVALTFRAARQRLGCLLRPAAQFFGQMEGVRHLFLISLGARGQFAGFGR